MTTAMDSTRRGFRAGHLGILYMRERVEGCGGRFEVRSRPGAGTEVHVTVPAGEAAP